MIKNWLIRTKNNHILGPVSKEKVKELVSNASIKGDDEICSGNGYWFFIREEELVQKYLFGDVPQGFNPVSEAESVKCRPAAPAEPDSDSVSLPSSANLEYPDEPQGRTPEREDMTLVGGMNVAALQAEAKAQAGELPQAPAEESVEVVAEEDEEEVKVEEEVGASIDAGNVNKYQDIELSNHAPVDEAVIKNKKAKLKLQPDADQATPGTKKKKKGAAAQPRPFLSENTLYVMVLVFFSLAVSAFYFRKRIIKNFIETSAITSFISVAHAQTIAPEPGKKKVLS